MASINCTSCGFLVWAMLARAVRRYITSEVGRQLMTSASCILLWGSVIHNKGFINLKIFSDLARAVGKYITSDVNRQLTLGGGGSVIYTCNIFQLLKTGTQTETKIRVVRRQRSLEGGNHQ